ncbi:MAG: sugar phosphate isomerase/epimerase family protein [Candidatus Hodarchaeaceae archaeon]|nr:sugar phosphate isomerase/epimerase family protein [Candidatus Hodarchaeaceae archaeon]
MRLGRDFTNCLVFDYLTDEQKRGVAYGQIDPSSMNALAIAKAKMDVERQIQVTRELGFEHLELDADSPNPYLNFDAPRRRAIREAAKSSDITLSLHLPYSYIGGSLCCPQDSDRAIAVELHKRCIEFASNIGAKYATTHPGSVPWYQRAGRYFDRARDALIRSLLELGQFANDRSLALCLENNTAFDGILSEPEECLAVIAEVQERGIYIYFNFDIGHWLTRADVGKPVPEPPENVLEPLPPDMLKELHLNDYVPKENMGEGIFHPPIHLGWGFLKRGNLERYARLVKRKGVEVVVLETAMKSTAQALERYELLRAESEFVREIFGV